MMRARHFILWVVLVFAVSETGCQWRTSRVFATEEDAERHLGEHLDEFTALADSWLSGGHSHLYWFGWSLLGREVFTWNDYWVRPDWCHLK
jgi:hypothetical protein